MCIRDRRYDNSIIPNQSLRQSEQGEQNSERKLQILKGLIEKFYVRQCDLISLLEEKWRKILGDRFEGVKDVFNVTIPKGLEDVPKLNVLFTKMANFNEFCIRLIDDQEKRIIVQQETIRQLNSQIKVLKEHLSKMVNLLLAKGDAELMDQIEEILGNKEK
eukprot:TRINITY_DN1747_c0_g1_i3.p1 TRINITY_DN1747_c0_g1~~TRINITY_DN1747_c0_g1_i3.p1  ORF type:complete len:161 (+),score=22.76 TRINITY_DN1747_c0_g1_i3:63-545(+)